MSNNVSETGLSRRTGYYISETEQATTTRNNIFVVAMTKKPITTTFEASTAPVTIQSILLPTQEVIVNNITSLISSKIEKQASEMPSMFSINQTGKNLYRT